MDAAILLPLYIYPKPGAWDPLYKAYVHTPTLQPITFQEKNY